MPGKWKKVRIDGNEKPIDAYQRDGYMICLANNHGLQGPGQEDKHGHHWWFEVTYENGQGKEHLVGEAPTLAKAKKLAAEHTKM